MSSRHYGDQRACFRCDSDIEWHGRDHGWADRGGNRYCDTSGQHPVDENGVSGEYPHLRHAESPRRLTGAALTATVVRNLRDALAEDYGLPMAEYDVRDTWSESIGSDMQPVMSIIFRRRSNGRDITIDNIYPGDDGSLLQNSMPALG